MNDSKPSRSGLIIEDSPDYLTLIVDILSLNGEQFNCTNTGLLGIDMGIRQLPDYIILDVQLPNIDGFEVVESLRSHVTTRKIPLIAMTYNALEQDRTRLLQSGCCAYIAKPIDTLNVMPQINQALAEGCP